MSADSTKKIKYLIADTTAFINAVPLNEHAENILTVPEVVAEVRNKRQLRRLCVLPFDLQVREPRVESVKHCVEFAKKTGDYASLSGIDIKVIALTYELEVEHVGVSHLRSEPVVSQVIASKETPLEFQDKTKLAGWYNPTDDSQSDDDDHDTDEEDIQVDEDNDEMIKEGVKAQNKNNDHAEEVDAVKDAIEMLLEGASNSVSNKNVEDVTEEQLEALFDKLKCEPDDNDLVCDILVPERKADGPHNGDEEESSDTDGNEEKHTAMTENIEDEDDSSWITPSNIKAMKKTYEGRIEEDIVPVVACMSTDFALQNVLKQLNLNVAALNGRIIKQVRTYILRCYACFKTTSIMTKVFCPNCGNKTLKRVAVSLDENGKQVIHINTRRPLTTKYKNQSLRRFQGGKHSRNPILFEDQPIPRQMPSRVAKTKTNAMNEDYIAGYSPFALRDVDSKSAMLRSKGHLREWARNNTFEEDRRKKHYNRSYK